VIILNKFQLLITGAMPNTRKLSAKELKKPLLVVCLSDFLTDLSRTLMKYIIMIDMNVISTGDNWVQIWRQYGLLPIKTV